jgi:hypothetical protein
MAALGCEDLGTAARKQQRLVLDPFGSGVMRAVSIMQAPPREGWTLKFTPSGEPVYVTDDGRILVQMLETTDAAGRRWRHVLAFLPMDLAGLSGQLAGAFFGQGARVHVEEPIETPGGSHVLVRLHRCLHGDVAGPPPPARPRARARTARRLGVTRPAYLRVVS